jgi:hypothetical protein
MKRTALITAAAAALALAGCGSSVNEQAIGTQSGRAFVACYDSHTRIKVSSIAQEDFAGDSSVYLTWAAGNQGPNLRRMYGTGCGAPTKPLTAKERAAAQVVVTAYTNTLH